MKEQKSPLSSEESEAVKKSGGQPIREVEKPNTEGKVSAEAGTIPCERAESSAAAENESPDGEKQYTPADIKKRRRGNIIGFILSMAIIVCVVFVLLQLSETLGKGDSATLKEILDGMNWWYVLAAAGLFIVMYAADTLKYTLLTRSYGYKLGIGGDMKVALIGKYYEGITPTATGGQPMQIYYFYKRGIPGTKSTSITMVKYAVQMLAVTAVAAIVMGAGIGALGMVEEEASKNVILICGWIGFSLNACIPFFVTFIVFCPRPISWFINLFVKLLHKIKIVKNADRIEAKIRKWIDDFAVFSQFVYKKPILFILLFLLCLVEPIIQFIIPYFLLIAMVGTEVMGLSGAELMFAVMALSMYATYSAAFIPTPGNSGAVESIFLLAFTAVASTVLFWYVLAWRFFTYYIYIVFGVGMNIYDLTKKIVRERREKRRSAKTDGDARS